MSTIDDLIPDVEYESDASTTSTNSIARRTILKEEPHFEKHDLWLSVFGILSFIIATLSINIPLVKNKIIDKGGLFVFILKLFIYVVTYFAFGLLHFFNVL